MDAMLVTRFPPHFLTLSRNPCQGMSLLNSFHVSNVGMNNSRRIFGFSRDVFVGSSRLSLQAGLFSSNQSSLTVLSLQDVAFRQRSVSITEHHCFPSAPALCSIQLTVRG